MPLYELTPLARILAIETTSVRIFLGQITAILGKEVGGQLHTLITLYDGTASMSSDMRFVPETIKTLVTMGIVHENNRQFHVYSKVMDAYKLALKTQDDRFECITSKLSA